MKIVHAAAKTSDLLKVFAIYRAIETDFAANFCDTCLPHIHRRSNLLFWELFDVDLLLAVWRKAWACRSWRSCRQRLGILRYHASGCLNHTLSSIDRRGRRRSSLSAQLFLAVTPNSEQRFTPHSALTYSHGRLQNIPQQIAGLDVVIARIEVAIVFQCEGLAAGGGNMQRLCWPSRLPSATSNVCTNTFPTSRRTHSSKIAMRKRPNCSAPTDRSVTNPPRCVYSGRSASGRSPQSRLARQRKSSDASFESQ
jgi:hypothetical protein